MTYEEELMVQGLTDMVRTEKKENARLRAEFEFLNRPRLSEYDGLWREIEKQQKTIDDQQETIIRQAKSLREILFKPLRQEWEAKDVRNTK